MYAPHWLDYEFLTPEWLRKYIGEEQAGHVDQWLLWPQRNGPEIIIALTVVTAVLAIWWAYRKLVVTAKKVEEK